MRELGGVERSINKNKMKFSRKTKTHTIVEQGDPESILELLLKGRERVKIVLPGRKNITSA